MSGGKNSRVSWQGDRTRRRVCGRYTKAGGRYHGCNCEQKQKNPTLTLEEAQNIALKHAGFSADQVMALHAEYEIEHGVPQYDVEFRHGYWEYNYEIHADTGDILSYSKDD